MKPKDVAERMSYSLATVYRLIDSGKLPVVKIGSALRVQEGDTIEEVNDDYLGVKNSSVPVTILKKGSPTYSEDFFQAVSKMEAGVPEVVQSEKDQYIFLVLKQKVDFREGEPYLMNRENCLRALKEADFLQEIRQEAEAYPVVKYDKVIGKLLK